MRYTGADAPVNWESQIQGLGTRVVITAAGPNQRSGAKVSFGEWLGAGADAVGDKFVVARCRHGWAASINPRRSTTALTTTAFRGGALPGSSSRPEISVLVRIRGVDE